MIELKNICKIYKLPAGRKTVLKDLSLSIPEGDYLIISGANGCGKTTLLNIIAGLLLPSSGEYNYNGKQFETTPRGLLRFRGEDIGYVSQHSFFVEKNTALKNILLPLELRHEAIHLNDINALAQMLCVDALLRKRVGTLSTGERQKISLIRALIKNPKLLLLDEPTSALDAASRQAVATLLADYNAKGGTVVVATHDKEFMTLGKRRLAMENGVLAEIYS